MLAAAGLKRLGLGQRIRQVFEPAEMLPAAGQGALGYAELVRSWWQDNLAKRPNRLRFSMATYLSNGGVADRQHGFGTWQRGPGQALVLEFTPPACEYWIFQLCNRWQENLDNYEDGQGYVTKFTVKPEADGRVRIVIAERDPGIGGSATLRMCFSVTVSKNSTALAIGTFE